MTAINVVKDDPVQVSLAEGESTTVPEGEVWKGHLQFGDYSGTSDVRFGTPEQTATDPVIVTEGPMNHGVILPEGVTITSEDDRTHIFGWNIADWIENDVVAHVLDDDADTDSLTVPSDEIWEGNILLGDDSGVSSIEINGNLVFDDALQNSYSLPVVLEPGTTVEMLDDSCYIGAIVYEA